MSVRRIPATSPLFVNLRVYQHGRYHAMSRSCTRMVPLTSEKGDASGIGGPRNSENTLGNRVLPATRINTVSLLKIRKDTGTNARSSEGHFLQTSSSPTIGREVDICNHVLSHVEDSTSYHSAHTVTKTLCRHIL